MTNPSNALRDEFQAKRRKILLLAAGSLAAFIPRTGRSGVESQKTTTAPSVTTAGRGFPDLKTLGPAHQVSAISHGDANFRVRTGDGRIADFQESDLRFKIDSSDAGPRPGAPVIMSAGSMGDRAWIFFAAPQEISTFIKQQS